MTLSKQTPVDDIPEIRVPLDTVCFIIEKARAFSAKSEPSGPAGSQFDEDDVEIGTLDVRPNDPIQAELVSYINDLSDGAQIDLVSIMWLGRQSGPDNFAEAQEIATEEHNDNTAGYLTGTPLLGDYLEEGLAVIGRSCGGETGTSV